MNQDDQHWLGRLSNLNVAQSERLGIAPHKPIMLLALMDLIEVGEYPDAWVPYDIRLVQCFRDYWPIVVDRRQNLPEIRMPFHALGSDQIWQRFTADKQPSKAKATTDLCHLNPQLLACLQSPDFRRAARKLLVVSYFTPPEQVALAARLNLRLPDSTELAAIKADRTAYKANQKKGRDSRFKTLVISGYHHTCLLTGYRLNSIDRTLVEAAHIHQHAQSGNDDPRNGLALSPNAHWAFDQGLWTVETHKNKLLVRVALRAINEAGPSAFHLANFEKRELQFPIGSQLRPDPKHFTWHQQNRYIG